jgi:hypothetical protein
MVSERENCFGCLTTKSGDCGRHPGPTLAESLRPSCSACTAKDVEIGKLNGECEELADSAVEAAKQRDAWGWELGECLMLTAGRHSTGLAPGEVKEAVEAQLERLGTYKDALSIATRTQQKMYRENEEAQAVRLEAIEALGASEDEATALEAQLDAVREYAESLTKWKHCTTTPGQVSRKLLTIIVLQPTPEDADA